MEKSHEVRVTPPALLPWEHALPTGKTLRDAVDRLPGWQYDETSHPPSLVRTWDTPDFITGMAWLTHVGELADLTGHHPDIALGWGYLRIAWTTHDCGGVHANDLLMAAATSALLERLT